MRVLICQTPRLTYVQAIELLQRENIGAQVDLAVFPELAIDHPPQCTGQGEMTFENVALLMLSRYCKQNKMYVVIGSMEERDKGLSYDTCIVFNRTGELLHSYRKQSIVGKTAGTTPGVFDSEYGPIGILLGAEVEEEQRWQDILIRRPCLILNPARAPMQLDPVLIHSHPNLQVSAWQKGLRRLEHIVETRTRQYACSFVRADAPFHEGGAGTSLLVEPHRSVLAPRWGPAFCLVDTLQPYELEGRKLPGWRTLSVDERARMAGRDRDLLTQEEIERGPRYLVWTLRPGSKGGMKKPGLATQWNAQRDQVANVGFAGGVFGVLKPAAFLVPLTSKDGHPLYASITSTGAFIIWDVKLKKELSSSTLGASDLSAASSWLNSNQLILASSSKGVTTLKVFEEHDPIGEIKLDHACKVTKLRSSVHHTEHFPHNSHHPRGSRKSHAEGRGARPTVTWTPKILALFHLRASQAVVVFEPSDGEHGPTAKLVDLEDGDVQDVDVYGSGPPILRSDDSDDDEVHEEHVLKHPSVDKLVQAHIVDHYIKGRLQRLLVCLYDSNRLVMCVFGGGDFNDLMLLEDGANERQRSDAPVCFAVLQNFHSDCFHLVASYQSAMVKFWQVNLTTAKLQSQTTLQAGVATHITMFDWPRSKGQSASVSLAVEKPPGRPTGRPKTGNSHFSAAAPAVGRPNTAPVPISRQKLSVVTPDPGSSRRGSSAPGLANRSRISPLPDGHPRRPSSVAVGHPRELQKRFARAGRRRSIQKSIGGGYVHEVPHDEFREFCLCIVAFDVMGGMPILLTRGGRMTKLYTCHDHFVDKQAKVDQLICDGDTIAVQISTGDVRHVEFVLEDDVTTLKDVPLELPV